MNITTNGKPNVDKALNILAEIVKKDISEMKVVKDAS